MEIVVYLLIIIINLLFAHKKKNSKIVLFISCIGILILMCGYRRPFYGDLDNYYYMYIGKQDLPIGMNFIFQMFRILKVDFFTVHYILLAFFVSTSIFIIKSFCDNWHYTVALYTCYYIIISADQIKNHTAFIFLCFAIYFLYKNKKLLAFLFILIASSIHYSFVVYFLLIFLSSKKFDKLKMFCILISVIYAFIAFFNIDSMIINTFIPMIISIFGSKVGDFATEKALMYLSTRTGGGFLLCIGLQCLNYYLLKYSRKLLNNNGIFWYENFVDFVIRINEIGFIVIPLFIYNMQWYRIIRDLLLFNYCVFGVTYFYLFKNSYKRMYYLLITLGSTYIWLIGDLCLKTTPNLVLIPFFTNNLFL